MARKTQKYFVCCSSFCPAQIQSMIKKACFKTITPIQNLNTNSKTVLSFFCIYIQVEPKVKVSDLKCKYGYI